MTVARISRSRTCRLVTLGCKVNQYESQLVKEALEAGGYRDVADDQPADLFVVNTCTVTMEGDAKSRQWIRRLHQMNPRADIVVMGCYATREPETIARLPGVTRVIADKRNLAQELRPFGVTGLPRGIGRFEGHQRAFVKVQDGCLLNCSYCIIPRVRPGLRSRSIDEIREEVAGLVAGGYREIVLTGIHLGHYGIDLSRGRPRPEWRRLWHLLETLNELPGEFRIRLSSLEAAEVRDDLVNAMRRLPRVVPHLHLCLQSGSDRILEAMKRRYRRAGFLERCRRLRDALDLPAFTTDIIVGFPGETEEDFEATCQVVQEVGFARLHVFSYSQRAGTAAAKLPERVPGGLVRQRRRQLREIERKLAGDYARRLLGRRLDVLIEGEDPNRPGHSLGTSCRYLQVSVPGHDAASVGKLVPVRAGAVEDGHLVGEAMIPGEPGTSVTGGNVADVTSSRRDARDRIPLSVIRMNLRDGRVK